MEVLFHAQGSSQLLKLFNIMLLIISLLSFLSEEVGTRGKVYRPVTHTLHIFHP